MCDVCETYRGIKIIRNGFGEYETIGLGEGDGCGFTSKAKAREWVRAMTKNQRERA